MVRCVDKWPLLIDRSVLCMSKSANRVNSSTVNTGKLCTWFAIKGTNPSRPGNIHKDASNNRIEQKSKRFIGNAMNFVWTTLVSCLNNLLSIMLETVVSSNGHWNCTALTSTESFYCNGRELRECSNTKYDIEFIIISRQSSIESIRKEKTLNLWRK